MSLRTRWATLTVAVLMAAAPLKTAVGQDSVASATIAFAAPPPEMERLQFLLGRWDNYTEFLDSIGNVVQTFHLTADLPNAHDGYLIRETLNGWTLEGGANGEYGRSWYRYDPASDRYLLFASDAFGNLDRLEGQFEGDDLVLVEQESSPGRAGRPVRWKWVFSDLSEDSYRIQQFASYDESGSWVLVNRQLQTRLPESVPESGVERNFVAQLEQWLGVWKSQTETANDGREFHFLFDLHWYDRSETIIAFTIHQVFDDGDKRLLWEGTKGYDPVRRVTFSDQQSAAGFMGRGVYAPGPDGTLVIHGRGFGPNGPMPPVRDVFEPLQGERAFRTTTYFFVEGEWQETRVDIWRPSS